jgi:hypothetical protein
MSTDIVATSQNIENIMSMLTKLENIKDDSSKLREISLDNTGWEGMDASSFNTALSNFTQKLDKTTNDIADALNVYLKKQEEQLAKGNEAEKTANNLDISSIAVGAAVGFDVAGLPGAIVGGAIGSHRKEIGEFLTNTAKESLDKKLDNSPKNIEEEVKETSYIRSSIDNQTRINANNAMLPPRRNFKIK